jgi:uncharacterized protein YjbI with pentapeptide repeats
MKPVLTFVLVAAGLALPAMGAIHRIDNGAWITDLDLPAALAAGIDLSWADLRGIEISGWDFNRAVLDHADLSQARVLFCDLERCSLLGARLDGALFSGCDLSRAVLDGASLMNTRMEAGSLNRTQLRGVQADGLELLNLDASRMIFDGSRLHGARIEGVNLSRAQGEGADLSGLWLLNANLDHIVLSEASLVDGELDGCSLAHADLRHARLDRFWIRSSSAAQARFDHAHMPGVRWEGSVSFAQASFEGACYDQESSFPAWFNRELEGMLPCDNTAVEAWDAARGFRLHGCWPNPFNPTATIRYEVEEPVDTRLEVFDIGGRRVASLHAGLADRGVHEATFDGSALASGMYLVRLSQAGRVDTRAVLLLK